MQARGRNSGPEPESPDTDSKVKRELLRRGSFAVVLAALALGPTGCSTTAGVTRVGLRDAYRDINAHALNQRYPSEDAKVVLHRYDLVERFNKDPASAIAILNEKVLGTDDRRDLRFVLAELNFLYADHLSESIDPEEHRRAPDHFMQAALSAYAYLLGSSREPPPGPYDRRFRLACDLYNRALGMALATGKGGRVEVRAGEWNLPVGSLTVSVDERTMPWPLDTFESFFLADDFSVHGFTLRTRTPGMGVPLIAVQRKTPESPKALTVPVTAFLRFSRVSDEVSKPRFLGTLELRLAFEESDVEVDGRRVPLETDSTAPLAYVLEDPLVWKAGVRRFLKLDERIDPGVELFQPYLPGRIPVVFVHGTASSPVWWAEMLNTLRSDPVLRKRYQYWYFRYNSNVPLVISAWQLRDSLAKMVRQLDAGGKDPALRQMVVVGHSQGGLLTKMSAVRTGDALWKSLSNEKLEDAHLDPNVKEELRRYLFIEPLPFVKRVVFLSTPHRGSFLSKGWVRSLVRSLVSLPADLTKKTSELFSGSDHLKIPSDMRGKIPTSVDGMSPENPVLQALVRTPLEPGVAANSIIPVQGEGDYRLGNDGVVEYKSAHLEGVESEFIVRSGHSCQGHPLAIEEVRRILLTHLGIVPGAIGGAGKHEGSQE